MTDIIKKAQKTDAYEIAKIHVAGWQGAYGGILDQDFIESKSPEYRQQQWENIFDEESGETLIYEKEGKPVGFISYGPLRTAPPGTSKIRPLYSSEIYAVYLYPEYYRQGIGQALLKQAAFNLKAQKHHSLCLWVLDKNKRACSFYEAMGGQRIGKMMVEFGPTKEKEVCYGWREIDVITSLNSD
ncbi:MAG TPA: GNAT family N-acetyltransferase [Alphaproteobacteria bacterium]|nr:GNAT family N-acetyltransferase [Alphaproteobacteria bacterium]